ncbi:hypothetical protein VPH35_035492 [Triticum aestivum]
MHTRAYSRKKKNNDEGVYGTTTDGQYDIWNPPYPPRDPRPPGKFDKAAHIKSVNEWFDKTTAILAKSRATNIIIPDRTSQCINDALFKRFPSLEPILDKDSVRSFLRFLNQNEWGMTWGFDPKLHGFRAHPNYMTQYGFLPLHRAADMFHVDMIGLLVGARILPGLGRSHGASANLRTYGDLVTGNLLPLHVAVDNTCMHKYLEDGLNPNQQRVDCSQADINYILKLIHIMCLLEMKLFLDTIRLLAKHTDNLLDELCKYIVDGKIVHTGVSLLAAQKQIRGVSSGKGGRSSKQDGFGTITNCVVGNITAIKFEMLLDVTLDLVHIISKAGEALDAYIQSHPKLPYDMEVAHAEVFEHVTLILKDCGFCSAGIILEICTSLHTPSISYCPYENVLSVKEKPHKLAEMARIKAGLEVPCLKNGKAKVKKDPRGWELKLARRSFFPYWRSVLTSQLCPGSPTPREMTGVINISGKSTGEALKILGGTPQVYQPRRLFGTVALTVLKALRKA